MMKKKGCFSCFGYKKSCTGVFFIAVMLFSTHSVFANGHMVNIVNNSTEIVTLSDFLGRCVSVNNKEKININPGGSYSYSWAGKKFEGPTHIACANSSKNEHTTEWLAFKMSTKRKGSSYAEYLGMTSRSERCYGLHCDFYNVGLFYAENIGSYPSDMDFNPLPYKKVLLSLPPIPDFNNGSMPDGIKATCDYMDVSQSCMDSFSNMVKYNDSFKLPFGLNNADHKWTFTITSPPTEVKITSPTENAHLLAEEGKGVDISGTAEPGSTVEFGYDGNPKNYTTKVGVDGKWKGSISYLDMLSQSSYGDITHSTIYARYVTQFTYVTQPDKKNIQIAEPVKVTVNGLDADNVIPVKSWTVQGMKSTTGTVSGEVCEEDEHKNCLLVPLSADNSMYWVTSVPIPTESGNYEFIITQKLKDFKDSSVRFSAIKNTPLSVSEPQEASEHSEPYMLTPAGMGSSGADVEYTIDGKSFPTVRITDDHWTGTQTSLASGSHTLVATEMLGSRKQDTVTRYFTVAASVVISSPTTNQWVSPNSTLTVTGKAEKSAGIKCVMDNNDWFGGTAIASPSTGDFSCKVSVPGDSGKHTVTVTQTISGKEQGKAVRNIVVAVPLTIESAVQDFKNNVMTIKGTKDKSTFLVYQLDDNKPSESTSFKEQVDWHVNFTGLTHGKHKFLAYQVIGGESSVPVEGDFEINIPVSITSPFEGGSVMEYTRFAIRGEGEPGASVQVEVNNIDMPWMTTVDGAGQWMIYGPRSGEGLYQYTATESKDGKTLNTVCRNVQVFGLNSPVQNESVDLCSENAETQGK
ncbi:TPA: hypothetical protein KNH08_001907 [Serratia fonticola]|nr:hypothetical protein [Serratia fonticola]